MGDGAVGSRICIWHVSKLEQAEARAIVWVSKDLNLGDINLNEDFDDNYDDDDDYSVIIIIKMMTMKIVMKMITMMMMMVMMMMMMVMMMMMMMMMLLQQPCFVFVPFKPFFDGSSLVKPRTKSVLPCFFHLQQL